MHLTTPRLELIPLSSAHGPFIFELLNSRGWKENIGDRNIHSLEDALAYTEKMRSMPASQVFVASLKNTGAPVGLITILKRDYLPFHDIGFAFLENYQGKGYAREATAAVLRSHLASERREKILGITLPTNLPSIKLLKHLGLRYQETIRPEGEDLQLYSGERTEVLAALGEQPW